MLPILPLKTNSTPSLHIFSSPPPIPSPRISNPHISLPPPIPIPSPPPLPSKKSQRPILSHNETTTNPSKAKGKHIFKYNGHCTTKLGEGRGVSKGEDEDGMSYKVEGAPFEFKFSYTESPKVKPLALREPPLTPFGPRPVNRPWFGRASLAKAKKMLPLLNPPPKDMPLFVPNAISFSRQKILGKPLTEDEVNELVDKAVQSTRKVNLGRDGLTHNMLELIHSHWRRRPVCKIRCKGVPTVDMDNVCHHLEEKTGGQIIHRIGGVVYLFRGRNYSSKYRPKFPPMLWKPANPVYPKLIEQAPDGLTVEEAVAMRRKGRHLPAICKLGKNGVYLDLVRNVREAFEKTELVRISCRGMKPSDYKRIGVKLKELVPCVLLSFDKENILMWRGKEYKVINSGGCAIVSSTYGSECLGDDSSSSKITGIQSTDGTICGELEEAATSLNTELVKQRIVASSSYSSLNDRRVASQFKESLELKLKKFPNSLQSKELISVVNNDNIFDETSNYQLHKQNDSDASEDENGLEVKDSSELVHASDAEGKSNATTFAINSSKTSSEAVRLPITAGVIDTKFMGTIENNSYDLLSKLGCKKHDMQGGDNVYEAKDTNEKGILTEEEANECSAKAEHVECLWPQAIESRIALLLDGPCLDPDPVSEISDKFAKKASQGSHVKSNRILLARKSGRGEKRAIRDEESSQSGGKVTFQDVNKESEEITHSSDMVPPGLLLLDDLAQLLLAP